MVMKLEARQEPLLSARQPACQAPAEWWPRGLCKLVKTTSTTTKTTSSTTSMATLNSTSTSAAPDPTSSVCKKGHQGTFFDYSTVADSGIYKGQKVGAISLSTRV